MPGRIQHQTWISDPVQEVEVQRTVVPMTKVRRCGMLWEADDGATVHICLIVDDGSHVQHLCSDDGCDVRLARGMEPSSRKKASDV